MNLFFLIFTLFITSCSGGGLDSTTPQIPSSPTTPPPSPTYSDFDLVDPNQALNHNFGTTIKILQNRNIIVRSLDHSNGTNNGAVHLYNPLTKKLLASFLGDNTTDFLGARSITTLSNNNFIISSPSDSVGGLNNTGSVILVDGSTGAQIGSTINGDNTGDQVGDIVVALANDNFVIASSNDDTGGATNTGSIMLFDGATGTQIGTTISGLNPNDRLGTKIIALPNNNFVIASVFDRTGASNGGSVMLIDGTSGVQIGARITGDDSGDEIGRDDIVALPNSNFVVVSTLDNVAGVTNAGSVMYINGTTGLLITSFAGDSISDLLGSSGITALSNSNFIISSQSDDIGGINGSGAVMLIDGTTGTQIGTTIAGDNTNDRIGSTSVTPLSNNNFIISSIQDDVGGIVDAGSVMLIDGTTGTQIGPTIVGDNTSDQVGSNILALTNNNFIIASQNDDIGGLTDAGSIMLIDGATGSQIGTEVTGDNTNDLLGSTNQVTLSSNVLVVSESDDVGGITDAGSIILVDGSTGVQIGTTISGDNPNDNLGSSSITVLDNNNFIIASENDDIDGITNAGSIILIDSTTLTQIGSTVSGDNTNDALGSGSVLALPENNYVIASPNDEVNGLGNAGSVLFRISP